MAARKQATTDQLRSAIDRGETGDKIRVLDPSAAPLGTDEEAAGTPVPGDAVEEALREERRTGPRRSDDPRMRPLVSTAIAALVYLTALGVLMWAMLA